MAEHSYRGFLIKTAISQGLPKSAIIAGPIRLAVVSGADLNDAEVQARLAVDKILTDAASKRGQPDVPSVEEYVHFFQANPAAKHEVAMLQAHASAPDRSLTATEIAQAAGWASFASANVHYGNLGRSVAEFTNLNLPSRDDGTLIYTAALATGDEADAAPDGHFRWVMHESLAEAVGILFP